jgi:hypothetical protein
VRSTIVWLSHCLLTLAVAGREIDQLTGRVHPHPDHAVARLGLALEPGDLLAVALQQPNLLIELSNQVVRIGSVLRHFPRYRPITA